MALPKYGITRELPDVSFEEAMERTVEALSEEGFGVLTEIDVKETLKEKLDVEFRQYRILGACNPPLAYQALQNELHLGLLLPCNVIVMEREGGGSVVSAVRPTEMFNIVDNPQMAPVARDVERMMTKVIQDL
ncbi:MAG: DUF302 domain-containing protein [bacterium]